MSWIDRVRGSIQLVSPAGQTFTAKWVGDQRSVEKKLGLFSYPRVNGITAQDLGLEGVRYPLQLQFDGPDNDLESTRFFEAFSASGVWEVTHPTKGVLTLQPVSVTERIEPVESGSITAFATEWLQLTTDATTSTPAQLASTIRTQADTVADTALGQLDTIAAQTTVEEVNALKTETETTLGVYDKTIGTLLETSGELSARAASVRRGIADTLSTTPLDLTVLGGQIQAVVRLPAQVTGDVLQVLKPFADFIDRMAELPAEAADQTYLNRLAIRELFFTSANSAIATASTTGTLDTRSQALEAVDLSLLEFQTLTDALDVGQEEFAALRVDQQYFSQSTTFSQSALITARGIQYLLQASFNLATEKRFTLRRERAPIEVTVTEYGTLGVNDSNFDLFIASNHLKGDEVLLLPAGREVVIYA